MMHVFTIGTMSFVLLTQAIFCRPFCPMPQRLSLKGIDFQGALLICGLMLVVSYIVVYGDYFMWFDTLRIRLLFGAAIVLFGIVLYRLRYYRYPYIELSLLHVATLFPFSSSPSLPNSLSVLNTRWKRYFTAKSSGWRS